MLIDFFLIFVFYEEVIFNGYLTMLSLSRLCSDDDTIINQCGAVDAMKIGRENHGT
jgi:hypothetical protein